jgi:hypothetical protein
MATRTGISTPVQTRLESDTQKGLFFAIKAEFDSGTIRIWSGAEDLTIGGEVYTGAGDLVNIAPVVDSNDLKSEGLTINISGMNSTIMGYAVNENYHFRPITFSLGYLMGDSNEVAGTLTLFKGRMTVLTINDNPNNNTITIQAENRLTDLSRPCNHRYTKETQEFLHSGDTFFNNINTIQDREITWGRATSNPVVGCFVAGSKVLMGDLTYRNIEDVQIGSSVMAYNEKTKKTEQALVQKISKPQLSQTVMIFWKLPFFKKGTIQCSKDHPLYVENKGWCSWDPKLTKENYKLDGILNLEKGDKLRTKDGTVVISDIVMQTHSEPVQAYNLVSIDTAHTYFVNDILVHNKGRDNPIDDGRYNEIQ